MHGVFYMTEYLNWCPTSESFNVEKFTCLQCISWSFYWRNSPWQPFLNLNWHFWQMTQMSDKSLLSKTEKTGISGQTHIIWGGLASGSFRRWPPSLATTWWWAEGPLAWPSWTSSSTTARTSPSSWWTGVSNKPSFSEFFLHRRAKPGGHWMDAYEFVRLHQPAAYYGVNSRPLENKQVKILFGDWVKWIFLRLVVEQIWRVKPRSLPTTS